MKILVLRRFVVFLDLRGEKKSFGFWKNPVKSNISPCSRFSFYFSIQIYINIFKTYSSFWFHITFLRIRWRVVNLSRLNLIEVLSSFLQVNQSCYFEPAVKKNSGKIRLGSKLSLGLIYGLSFWIQTESYFPKSWV